MKQFLLAPFQHAETDRLYLRPLQGKDVIALHVMRIHPAVNEFLDRPVPETEADSRDFLRKIQAGYAENKWLYWAIERKEKPGLIGTICLWQFSEDMRSAELGYELHPAYQGRGFMGESLRKVMEIAFSHLPVSLLKAVTRADNVPSYSLLQKAGFQFIRMLHPEEKAEEEQHIELALYSRFK
ncbi:MAG: GNAT family N-acetyltransferase [Bacteroidota bacterium]